VTVSLRKPAPRRDNVATQTYSRTIHVVHIDAADLLAGFDVTDEVVLMVSTPSGRDQRVAIRPNLLAPTRTEEYL
jgi:hypothetical protein